MRGMEGPLEIFIAGVATGVVLTVTVSCSAELYGSIDDDDPLAEDKESCLDAWSIANDGDDGTQNETAILEQRWCDDYLKTVTTMTTTTEAQP
jgi:hypothetical protein